MLPKDSYILFSILNTKLRDNYPSLVELCKAECADYDEITEKMAQIGYHYDEKTNSFIK